LERFAAKARCDLLAAVDAQATAVLAPGSVARIERAGAVKKLEAEIAAQGRTHVIDKVAYTWFNRIIALRFMDARSYTEAGVVSPAKGQAHGQPEILADAKRGNLNTDVVINKDTAEAIIGLLDGTRRSTDAEGEAYALLLTEYCRYWHKAMPFMFEREGDYTELLVPAGLLADGSILSRARMVLTDEVCDDVEVIGWLYQFYISERKQEIFDSKGKRGAAEIPAATQLFTPHWIVRYLVENSLGRLWMLNRPTSRVVDQMDYYIPLVDEETDFLTITGPEELTVIDPACGSGHMLTYAFDLLYAIYEEEGYAPYEIPGLILTHNLHGTEIDPRAGSLAAFALTMKARAKQRTFFSKQVEPKICVVEPTTFVPHELDILLTASGDKQGELDFWNQFAHADTLGSLIRSDRQLTVKLRTHVANLSEAGNLFADDTLSSAERVLTQAEYLSRAYSVVVTNPPYMGNGYMDARLSDFAKEQYPESKADLFAMFIQRSFEMLQRKGYSALVTMESWMFLRAYKDLREGIVSSKAITAMVHMPYLGKGGTPMGINFGTAATVIANRHAGEFTASFQCIRYFETDSNGVPLTFPAQNERLAEVNPRKFLEIPGTPIAYWVSDTFRSAFAAESLSAHFVTRLGMSTANNDRFLRLWPEVSSTRLKLDAESRQEALESGARWFPYQKGGNFRKWYGNLEFAVNWEADGKEVREFADDKTGRIRSHNYNLDHIFRQAITWSDFTSAANAFRLMPAGQLFDGRGSAGFANSEDELYLILGILNSRVSNEAISAINPTIAINVGEIARLPFPKLDVDDRETITSNVARLVDLHRMDWDNNERSVDFLRSPLAEIDGPLSVRVMTLVTDGAKAAAEARTLEEANNRVLASAYGLEGEIEPGVAPAHITLSTNSAFRFPTAGAGAAESLLARELVRDLVSYAVGCMFGRYSLDQPGLILGDQGATLQDYLMTVSSPSFLPDADNVIPVVDDGWFADDIVERFRQLLRAAFGTEHFEENLHFVEESLGVKTLRDYFITRTGKSKFYDEHVQRYRKRPIYWMFSSPEGSFNALIYMHRYNPSTVSTVLNEYLREYRAKLEVALINVEQAAATGSSKDQKEADRLRRVLAELRDYEHDVLYPLATQQLTMDLDDGVKANYPKFYPALKKIAGLEEAE
jgi:type II restriction/modification system DNA methylase subunit YeeA